MLKGDSLLIKRINQMAILRYVQQHEPSSRYDIARACGLSNSTVSTLIAELMEIGIIKTVGEGPSIGGRRPVVLGINEEAGSRHRRRRGVDHDHVRPGRPARQDSRQADHPGAEESG